LTISAPSDAASERTEVLRGEQNVIGIELQFFSNSDQKIDTCMNHTRPVLAITIGPIGNAFIDAKKRGVKLRYVLYKNYSVRFCCNKVMLDSKS
jgi:hypothetical protein